MSRYDSKYLSYDIICVISILHQTAFYINISAQKVRDETSVNSLCRAQSCTGRVLFTVTSLSNVVRREEHRDIPMLIERSDGRETTQVEKQEWATRVRRRG